MKRAIEKSIRTTKFMHKEDTTNHWYIVDAKDKILGRLATKVASVIRGKHKAQFTPNTDTGDFVIVINAEKIKVTGKRPTKKEYKHHTLYPGGQKIISFKDMLAKHPERIIQDAVSGMLPKTRLGKSLNTKLKVYAGETHPHASQQPINLTI